MSTKEKQIRIYAEAVPGKAADQFYGAMKQEFAVSGALMPDVHQGYALPIGAVVATDDVVVPSWVGYDIGCGVCAYPLPWVSEHSIKRHGGEIFKRLREEIPSGASVNEKPSEGATSLSVEDLSDEGRRIAEEKRWLHALGTLGGGNHFLEIGVDYSGMVWVVIHSGSRGVGHGIAAHYMRQASPDGKATEGHHGLDVHSELGKAYINDQGWCLFYAEDNRKEMMRRAVNVIAEVVHGSAGLTLSESELIDSSHNHVLKRRALWIHRKGAAPAEKGQSGVVPGNMKDGTFIVRGLGNPDSLWSSAHGAGRVLSRRAAKETLDLRGFEASMKGIIATVDERTLDESPYCYKDIFSVMQQQSELVRMVLHVRPLLNLKGV